MSTRNRKVSSSKLPPPPLSSSSARRQSKSEKVTVGKAQMTMTRPPLANITNQKDVSRPLTVSTKVTKPKVPCPGKVAKMDDLLTDYNMSSSSNRISVRLPKKSRAFFPCKGTSALQTSQPNKIVSSFPASYDMEIKFPASKSIIPATSNVHLSPVESVCGSVSLDETMSTCDSLKSPEFDYLDNEDTLAFKSIDKKTSNGLNLPENKDIEGNINIIDVLLDEEETSKVDDKNITDPRFCTTIASDIYMNLRKSEVRKRPSADYMEKVQKDISPSMRAVLIDWLVEVAEEYSLLPETLFLTVNYIDRYLSGHSINRQQLQLLGVASMLIAAKYEEVHAPDVEAFCYITDNTYLRKEVLEMESAVLNYLKYEMTAPTAKCFLRHFARVVHAAQEIYEVSALKFECLANYLAELSLLDYNMLCYAPSLVAASATFLAKFIISPTRKPWNSTLRSYTLYHSSDLHDCVKALHHLYTTYNSHFAAIREKYSQHKLKFVAKKYCPKSIPQEFFQNSSF